MAAAPPPTPVKPSFWADLWDTIVTLLKGLGVTGKNLWRVVVQRQAVTITEQWGSRPIALRYRGTIGLTIDRRTGKENCIGCLACERICPDHCIHIETIDEKPGHKASIPSSSSLTTTFAAFAGSALKFVLSLPSFTLKSGKLAVTPTEIWSLTSNGCWKSANGNRRSGFAWGSERLIK